MDFFLLSFFFRPTDPSNFEKNLCSRKLNWSGLTDNFTRIVLKKTVVKHLLSVTTELFVTYNGHVMYYIKGSLMSFSFWRREIIE